MKGAMIGNRKICIIHDSRDEALTGKRRRLGPSSWEERCSMERSGRNSLTLAVLAGAAILGVFSPTQASMRLGLQSGSYPEEIADDPANSGSIAYLPGSAHTAGRDVDPGR